MLYSHISDLTLPKEIILKIIEAMDYEPKLFVKLMCISKDFRKLIITFEGSISTHFALKYLKCGLFLSQCGPCGLLSKTERLSRRIPVMSSRFTSFPLRLQPGTFHWLREFYGRFVISNEVVQKRFQIIMDTIYQNFPDVDNDGYCLLCLHLRVEMYLRLSVHVLFGIFDARHDNSGCGRAAQEDFVKRITDIELALVNFLVFTTAIYICYFSSYWKEPVGVQKEMQFVYKELALRYGPQFIWESLFGDERQQIRVIERIERGRAELRIFWNSRGTIESNLVVNRSLQGVMMMEFCKRANCDRRDAWITLLRAVKRIVLFPEPNKPHVH